MKKKIVRKILGLLKITKEQCDITKRLTCEATESWHWAPRPKFFYKNYCTVYFGFS